MAQKFFLYQQLKHAITRKTVVFSLTTVILHILFFEFAAWEDWSPQAPQKTTPSIQISLRPAQDITNATPQTSVAANKSLAKPSQKKKLHPITKTKTQTIVPEPIVTQEITLDELKLSPLPEQENPTSASPSPAEEHAVELVVRIPSSIEMELAVTHTKVNATPTKGVATLSWQVYNNRYKLKLEVGVNLVITTLNLYSLSSEGEIGPFGLMPNTSTDERKTKAPTAIHFNHSTKTITFSAGNKTVAMQDGAQDAASLLLQLTAIGSGNPKQFTSGKEFSIQVAEGRDVNDFLFQVLGEEEIDSELVADKGSLNTIHIVRAPRPGAYNSRLDIWLAPSLNWYPVQIRNTESNGTVTNQIVTAFKNRVNQNDK